MTLDIKGEAIVQVRVCALASWQPSDLAARAARARQVGAQLVSGPSRNCLLVPPQLAPDSGLGVAMPVFGADGRTGVRMHSSNIACLPSHIPWRGEDLPPPSAGATGAALQAATARLPTLQMQKVNGIVAEVVGALGACLRVSLKDAALHIRRSATMRSQHGQRNAALQPTWHPLRDAPPPIRPDDLAAARGSDSAPGESSRSSGRQFRHATDTMR